MVHLSQLGPDASNNQAKARLQSVCVCQHVCACSWARPSICADLDPQLEKGPDLCCACFWCDLPEDEESHASLWADVNCSQTPSLSKISCENAIKHQDNRCLTSRSDSVWWICATPVRRLRIMLARQAACWCCCWLSASKTGAWGG